MTNDITRDALLADLEKWEASHARWEAEAATSEAEIDGIRARMGEAVLADEDQAAILSSKVRDLRDRVDVAKRAAAAAAPKVSQARSAVLLFDAELADREVAVREKALISHTTKTTKLLKALEDHEGRFAPDGSSPAKSLELERDVQRAQLLSDVLRDAAAGQDPMDRINQHPFADGTALGLPLEQFMPPALWGPQAVAPIPHYVRRVESARSRLEQLDSVELVDVEPQIAELKQRIQDLNETLYVGISGQRVPRTPTEDEAELLEGLRWKISELRSQPQRDASERAQVEAELAELLGTLS